MRNALLIAMLAASAASAQVWKITILSAEKTLRLQPGWERMPFIDPANCLLVVKVRLDYIGPDGDIPAPRVAAVDQAEARYPAWGNLTCVYSDKDCMDNMGWLLSATHATPDTRALKRGAAISMGSLTYYFEVPRAAAPLRLSIGDSPLLPMTVEDNLRPGPGRAPAPVVPVSTGPKIPAVKPDARAQARGRELLQRAQQAMGGVEKLASVKDYTQVSTVTIKAASGTVQGKQTIRWTASGHFRQDIETPSRSDTFYCDGSSGWWASDSPAMELPEPWLEELKTQMLGDLFSAVLSDRDAGRTVNAVSDTSVEISDRTGHSVQVVFTPDGLPLRILRAAGAGFQATTETLLEWREVNGLRLPHSVAKVGSSESLTVVQEWKLNTGLKAEELSRKP